MSRKISPKQSNLGNSQQNDADEFFFSNFDFKNNSSVESIETDVNQNVQQVEDWMVNEFEGQLSVDVYQTKLDIVVKATIAGIKPNDLDIFVDNDMLTIRGKRSQSEEICEEDYFYRECYWGGFSRSIILPVDVKFDQIKASLDNGVLTIRLPRLEKSKKIKVDLVENK